MAGETDDEGVRVVEEWVVADRTGLCGFQGFRGDAFEDYICTALVTSFLGKKRKGWESGMSPILYIGTPLHTIAKLLTHTLDLSRRHISPLY